MAKDEGSPARQAIIEAWNAWALRHPIKATGSDGMLFFNYLQAERSDLLLDFKSSGDKWRIIHAWLLAARKVKR
jgi:hypothetical protein